jgi:hypothetical protein
MPTPVTKAAGDCEGRSGGMGVSSPGVTVPVALQKLAVAGAEECLAAGVVFLALALGFLVAVERVLVLAIVSILLMLGWRILWAR